MHHIFRHHFIEHRLFYWIRQLCPEHIVQIFGLTYFVVLNQHVCRNQTTETLSTNVIFFKNFICRQKIRHMFYGAMQKSNFLWTVFVVFVKNVTITLKLKSGLSIGFSGLGRICMI